jgi:predicted lipid-binding transport protein (Tim44 family)
MKKVIATVALAISLVPSATMAQERGGDAALGALSGAIVFGPVGAVAGALVGYTAGPLIARSWGVRRSGTARHARRSVRQETQVSRVDGQPAVVKPAAANQVAAPAAAQAPPPRAASNAPPVQGWSEACAMPRRVIRFCRTKSASRRCPLHAG